MKEVDLKIQTKSRLPSYGSKYSAGMDIYCSNEEDIIIGPGQVKTINTGLRMEIPEGYFGAIYPRSSAGIKLRISLANSTGIIDSDYRGEIVLALVNNGDKDLIVKKNDRLVQMVIQPYVKANILLVDSLEDSERGQGGLGSTGR